MPLIIITGFPCSCKSLRASQLENYFRTVRNIETLIISDPTDINKNLLYADSQKEKIARSSLKSSIQRYIGKEKLIICDSLNYIKGFRYELFCIVKSAQTTKCLIYCHTTQREAHLLNDQHSDDNKYNKEILDGLIQRYEAPNPNNKWDFPLFNAPSILAKANHDDSLLASLNLNQDPLLADGSDLPFEDIYNSLYKSKPLPPNLSTLPQALSSTNFLNELDSITQNVVKEYIEAQRHCLSDEAVTLLYKSPCGNQSAPPSPLTAVSICNVPCGSLLKLRREFINYTRQHPPASEHPDAIRQLFIHFLQLRLS